MSKRARNGCLRLVAVLVALALNSAVAEQPGSASSPADATALTHDFNLLAEQYRHAATVTIAQQSQLVALARARRSAMQELVQTDPGAVLHLTTSDAVRRQLPPRVTRLLETQRTLQGQLKVVFEDRHADGRIVHWLQTSNEDLALHYHGVAPQLASGVRVRITGVDVGGRLAVDPAETEVLTLALDGEGSGSVASLSNTIGEQRTAVLLVNFQDNPAAQPYSLPEASSLVFGSVSDHLFENSSGRTWLTGDVYGWYTLPFDQPTDPATCRATEISAGAQQAALNDGVDLTQYARYIYVFPQTSCLPSASGTVGGSPSEAWINGFYFTQKSVTHELGHNLGLFHAGALECGSEVTGSGCQSFPYGDTVDVMGNQSAGHFNAYKKERLGWLDAGQGQIVSVTTSGSYTIGTFELPTSGIPQAIKVLKSTDPLTGERSWYYVEYRQAIGFDSFLSGNSNVLNGVVIREAVSTATPAPVSSFLLDMTPASATYSDWQDPALAFGQSFTDPVSGVTITAEAGDSNSATVSVNFAATGCVTAVPGVSASPGQGQDVTPGSAVTFTVGVTNNDSASCASSVFDLGALLPGGWTATFVNPALALEPGATATTTLTVTSASTAADGVYDIDVTAVNPTSGHGATTSIRYAVQQVTANQPPLALDDSVSTVQDTPVTIDVLGNDSDPEGAPLHTLSASDGAHGITLINPGGSVTYSPRARFKGQDSFTYLVSDGDQTTMATVQVTVNRKSGGGGGGGKGGNGRNK